MSDHSMSDAPMAAEPATAPVADAPAADGADGVKQEDAAPAAASAAPAAAESTPAASSGLQTTDIPPNQTLYVNNLNEKIKKVRGSRGGGAERGEKEQQQRGRELQRRLTFISLRCVLPPRLCPG